MARPKKKPKYKSETIMKELIAAVVELYLDSGENVSIRQIADEFGISNLCKNWIDGERKLMFIDKIIEIMIRLKGK